MSRGAVEVRRTTSNRWGIVIQGTYATRKEAQKEADRIARILGVERHTRGLLGRILSRNSYGNDPTRTKG